MNDGPSYSRKQRGIQLVRDYRDGKIDKFNLTWQLIQFPPAEYVGSGGYRCADLLEVLSWGHACGILDDKLHDDILDYQGDYYFLKEKIKNGN